MKKAFLFSFTVSLGFTAFAQSFVPAKTFSVKEQKSITVTNPVAKTTGNGDTTLLINFGTTAQGDTLADYILSSPNYGKLVGTNSVGSKGFAERYNFNGADSSLKLLGVGTLFTGTYTPTTTKTITVNAWSQGTPSKIGNYYYDGFPTASLGSSNAISIKNLGINMTGGSDSLKLFSFASIANSYVSDTFFVGYQINYTPTALNGDTIGVYSTRSMNGNGIFPKVVSGDTLISVNNAVQDNSGVWKDEFTQNAGLFHNFALFAVVEVKWTTGVHHISNGDFTFYGTYPNPATTQTNVKIGLKKATDVTVLVTDMTGRTIQTIANHYNAGEQTITINTAQFAAGNYLCVIRTAENDGIASKFTVEK